MKRIFFFLLLFLYYIVSNAQEIQFVYDKTTLSINEPFALSIVFSKDKKREYKAFQNYIFPDVADLVKDRTLFTEESDGSSSITQYYLPLKKGSYVFPPLLINLKNDVIFFPGTTLYVNNNKFRGENDSGNDIAQSLTFKDEKLDAYLELNTSHTTVYCGQAFCLQVNFMVSVANRSEFTFFDLAEQRKKIIQLLKSMKCYSNDAEINDEIPRDTAAVGSHKYVRWQLYKGYYYPMVSETIVVPALELTVLGYKYARNGNISIERKITEKQFKTSPIKINVLSLPPHPMSDVVPVGEFSLHDKILSKRIHTGSAFEYQCTISGDGYAPLIMPPVINENEVLEFYTNSVSKQMQEVANTLRTFKTINYSVICKEPGQHNLADYISWIYFNPLSKSYDTLKSNLVIHVSGNSIKNNYISLNHPDVFYQNIKKENNQLHVVEKTQDMQSVLIKGIILVMLGVSVWVLFKK
ncbi:MAG: hypothetical protein NZ529_02265 [Cytophagaceae bacterium]|nr:hypothetical protein [Cytophagaceae bacterium]MDW8455593.1 hypothetical protein [Cytophagaceae bacterium]